MSRITLAPSVTNTPGSVHGDRVTGKTGDQIIQTASASERAPGGSFNGVFMPSPGPDIIDGTVDPLSTIFPTSLPEEELPQIATVPARRSGADHRCDRAAREHGSSPTHRTERHLPYERNGRSVPLITIQPSGSRAPSAAITSRLRLVRSFGATCWNYQKPVRRDPSGKSVVWSSACCATGRKWPRENAFRDSMRSIPGWWVATGRTAW